MKITINKKEQEPINWRELPEGTIFEVKKSPNNIFVLKLAGCNAVILNWSSGEDCFYISDFSIPDKNPIIRVCGKISEIIVEGQ